jgi:ApaG protein
MNKIDDQILEFSETTNSIKVIVIPTFSKESSNKERNSFVWNYDIRVENISESIIQIMSRHWQIFDSNGKVEEVKGEGLIGYQPIIKPGEFFEYQSQVNLFTQSGLMRGEYLAIDHSTADKKQFLITVPAFSLDAILDRQKFN